MEPTADYNVIEAMESLATDLAVDGSDRYAKVVRDAVAMLAARQVRIENLVEEKRQRETDEVAVDQCARASLESNALHLTGMGATTGLAIWLAGLQERVSDLSSKLHEVDRAQNDMILALSKAHLSEATLKTVLPCPEHDEDAG